MIAVVSHGGLDRYDDLHVDQIDPNWKARAFWVSAGLESLETRCFPFHPTSSIRELPVSFPTLG